MARIPSSDGTLRLCYSKSKGALRVIDRDKGAKCTSKERTLTINQKGPTGAAGAAGSQGAQGEQGVQGPTGQPGADASVSSRGTVATTQTTTENDFNLPGADLGGPSATVTVPAGGSTIIVAARAEIESPSGGCGQVHLFEDGVLVAQSIVEGCEPTFTAAQGTRTRFAVAGSRTYQLKYTTDGSTSSFRNRQLIVTVLK